VHGRVAAAPRTRRPRHLQRIKAAPQAPHHRTDDRLFRRKQYREHDARVRGQGADRRECKGHPHPRPRHTLSRPAGQVVRAHHGSMGEATACLLPSRILSNLAQLQRDQRYGLYGELLGNPGSIRPGAQTRAYGGKHAGGSRGGSAGGTGVIRDAGTGIGRSGPCQLVEKQNCAVESGDPAVARPPWDHIQGIPTSSRSSPGNGRAASGIAAGGRRRARRF